MIFLNVFAKTLIILMWKSNFSDFLKELSRKTCELFPEEAGSAVGGMAHGNR